MFLSFTIKEKGMSIVCKLKITKLETLMYLFLNFRHFYILSPSGRLKAVYWPESYCCIFKFKWYQFTLVKLNINNILVLHFKRLFVTNLRIFNKYNGKKSLWRSWEKCDGVEKMWRSWDKCDGVEENVTELRQMWQSWDFRFRLL